ncbi:hypothetical protein J4438_03990 [Candidatus Woesearchaeota archaeon]|nr:hypothetical protein [Candidatus Woesearchaeota archaeon]
MNEKIKIITIIILIVCFFFLSNVFGAFSSLNKYVSGTPDKHCSLDSDCILKDTTCGYCDCGDTVNEDWDVFCPFRNPPARVKCSVCASPGYNFDIKCVNNQCEKVWKNNT